MALYQDEFLAATSTVTVSAQSTATANIAATAAALTGSHTTIFKLGDYDGQPTGFLNADKQLRMHPSDSRMSAWKPGTISGTATGSFPMAIFTAVNNGQVISFSLGSAVSSTATIRIATTLAFAGGRPQAKVNGYTCAAPAAPTAVDSRGVTRGAYRGRGYVYDCSVPSGTLVSGTNTVTITVISGSSGDTYLSPNVVSTIFLSTFYAKFGQAVLLDHLNLSMADFLCTDLRRCRALLLSTHLSTSLLSLLFFRTLNKFLGVKPFSSTDEPTALSILAVALIQIFAPLIEHVRLL